ncbi:MAG: DNA translocase FtsK 4TM domain-containing protein, partial [Candidatus Delongbacteria bacterium]|nr:DNA translocase FtsK 4TM domain-containing protein [Candidatus Delongbacteria bacterium]
MAQKKRKVRRKKITPAAEFRILLLLLAAVGISLILLSPFWGDQVGASNNRMGRYGIELADLCARATIGRYLVFLLPLALFHSLWRRSQKRNWPRFIGRYLLLALLGAVLVASLHTLGVFTSPGLPPDLVIHNSEILCGYLPFNFVQALENAAGWPGVLLLLAADIGVAIIFFTRLSVIRLATLVGRGLILIAKAVLRLLSWLVIGLNWLGKGTFRLLNRLWKQIVSFSTVRWQRHREAVATRARQREERQEATRLQQLAEEALPPVVTEVQSEPVPDVEPVADRPQEAVEPVEPQVEKLPPADTADVEDDQPATLENEAVTPVSADFSVEDEFVEEEVPWQQQQRVFKKEFALPPVELLQEVEENRVYHISQEEMRETAVRLELQLKSFNVAAQVVHVAPGPVITRYELELAPGVKVNSITNLADDLLIAMRTESIRVVPHIPGKAVVGVELPNPRRNTVYLRNVINTDKFATGESPLLLALGKTTSGEAFVADLRKMPHLLIAGRTGAGKSVCINAVIASILYRARPTEVQFVLIDPKMIELADYKVIRDYYLCSLPGLKEEVITRPDNAVHILNAVGEEMERRYLYLSHTGYRNIQEFNEVVDKGLLTKMEDGSRAE